MLKPSQSAKEIFKTYKTFLYEDIYYITLKIGSVKMYKEYSKTLANL